MSVLRVVGGHHGGVGDGAQDASQVGHQQGDPEPVVSGLQEVRQGGCVMVSFMTSIVIKSALITSRLKIIHCDMIQDIKTHSYMGQKDQDGIYAEKCHIFSTLEFEYTYLKTVQIKSKNM